jgi:hypothetical protein
MFLLIRVFENSFTKFSIRYSEDSINHVEHVSVLVNAEQEWLTLYMKECCVSAGMLKVTSGIFIVAKYARIWNKWCREMFYAQWNFSQGILYYAVLYFEKIWLILIESYYQAGQLRNLGSILVPAREFYLPTTFTPAVGLTPAYWIDSVGSFPGSKATAAWWPLTSTWPRLGVTGAVPPLYMPSLCAWGHIYLLFFIFGEISNIS